MFTHHHQIRIRYIIILVLILFITIIGKILYLEVFSYNKLNKLANDLWSRNLPITAERGRILDRNGKELATNITTVSLYLVPSQIKDKEEVTNNLAKILDVPYEQMKKHVYKNISLEKVHPEGRNLSSDKADQIKAYNYDGVYLLKEAKRYYPNNELLAHTLGFTGIDNQGLSGIELKYNDYLEGTDGSIKYYADAKGHLLEKEEDYILPIKGNDVYLTIDLELQKALERELNNAFLKYNPEHAIGIAIDPNTGEILAIASKPSYDPNNYKNVSKEVLNRNLPIWMTYEPGSTMKITTLSASLNEHIVDLFKDTYYDGGSITVSGAKLHCWKSGGHGAETYLEVVQNSCNPGFANLGLKLGKERLFDYIKKFGFGEKTGIDLDGEENGILFNMNKVGDLELATTAFGQGISVTPLQQVRAVSAAINGGTLYKPYILSKIANDKSTLKENEKEVVRENVIDKDTSSLVRFTLEQVVAKGTGKNAYIENYRVGGKTGTAQKVANGRYMVGNYITSFIGFMPADKPEIVLYIAIDHPQGITQYGGTVAAPIAKKIFQDYIAIHDLEEAKEITPRTYTWLDQKYSELPNVVGKSLKEAQNALKNYTLIYSGDGDKVTYQSPKGGLYVPDGTSIKLLLDT